MLNHSYKEDITTTNDNKPHNVALSTFIADVLIAPKHNKTIKMHKLKSIHIFNIRVHGNGFNNILQASKEATQPQPKLRINQFNFISISECIELFQTK